MPAPYDYTALVGGFQSPEKAFVDSISMVDALKKQQLEKEETASMKADLQALQVNPSPQAFASFYLKHPKAKEQVESYRTALSDADKKTTLDFASTAFGLNRAGRTDDVVALFDKNIQAAKNSNRPDLVKQFEDGKDTYLKLPDAKSREAVIASVMVAQGKEGEDLYKNVWKADAGLDLDTALIKNVVALGYKVGTPEFQKELRKQMDKITVTLPNGTFVQGTPDEIRMALGQQGGNVLPRANTKEEAMRLPPGTDFIGPDNQVHRVPGGQSGSAPTGNFPR